MNTVEEPFGSMNIQKTFRFDNLVGKLLNGCWPYCIIMMPYFEFMFTGGCIPLTKNVQKAQGAFFIYYVR